MKTHRLHVLVILVATTLALGACKKKGKDGSSPATSSTATLDRAYAAQFFNAAAAAFKKHRAAGEMAAKEALVFVRANRAKHDKLKAYFKTLNMTQYLAMTQKPDEVGKAIMAFSGALAFVKDMATAYRTKAWQEFTGKEQPRPGSMSP